MPCEVMSIENSGNLNVDLHQSTGSTSLRKRYGEGEGLGSMQEKVVFSTGGL
jgi:hypothetical protein